MWANELLVPFKKLETLFALFKSVILDISSTLGRKTCLAIELYVELLYPLSFFSQQL